MTGVLGQRPSLPRDSLLRSGFLLLSWAVLAGAVADSVTVIVVGQAAGLAALVVGVWLRHIRGEPLAPVPAGVRALQVLLLAAAGFNVVAAFPAGRYTAVSLAGAALVIEAMRSIRLPATAHFALGLFVATVYAKLALGAQGFDHVALHSKNYVFVFAFFFFVLHVVERHSRGEPPMLALGVVPAAIGFMTLGAANIVVAAALLAVLAAAGGWRTRMLVASTVAAVVVLGWFAETTRDTVLAVHIKGVEVAVQEGRSEPAAAPIANDLEALQTDAATPFADVRISIWRTYLGELEPRTFLFGGEHTDRATGLTLHNSYLHAHAKFGLLAVAVVTAWLVLVVRGGLMMAVLGWLLLLWCVRAGADTIAFSGTYFDFGIVGAAAGVAAREIVSGQARAPREGVLRDRTSTLPQIGSQRP